MLRFAFVCMFVHVHVCVCVCLYVCVCLFVCVCGLLIPHSFPPADIPYCDDKEGIRLIHNDSVNSSRGMVQVCHYGVWMPVCGQAWSDEEASLACKQLGFVGERLCLPAHVL